MIETVAALLSVVGAGAVVLLFFKGLVSVPKHPSERERWRDQVADLPVGVPADGSREVRCLEGRAEGRPVLQSPVRGVRCLAYLVLVDEMHADRQRTPTWVAVRRERDVAPFVLVGAFGNARVVADAATDLVGATIRSAVASGFFSRNDEAERRYLDGLGVAASSAGRVVQVREWTLLPGTICTVVGQVSRRSGSDGDERGYREAPETTTVGGAEGKLLAVIEGRRAEILGS